MSLEEKTAMPEKDTAVMWSDIAANHQPRCSDEGGFVPLTSMGSGARSSITPGAMHVTWTWLPGLNPARSSQHPTMRIFGLMMPL
jgi:hypothetical protein